MERETVEKPFWRRLMHYGPIIALLLVFCITTSTLFCHIQWWPPMSSLFACASLLSFCLASCCTMSNLLLSSFVGPGFVPLGWTPVCH
ncbi:unnamed protein product [Soboliphyme baturini]|uniref:Vesicle transport protein n=1 Tax=Soboliphyme baturini TaxID=241478 RepID=A0A183J9S5_9BILA|nr:unnamed protein product [Soboliphyme baturini]